MSDPRRLDLALIAQNPGLSRRKARDVIEKGQVSVDGVLVTEAGHPVPPRARIEWDPDRKAQPRVRSSLPILYRDDDLVIIVDSAAWAARVRYAGPRMKEQLASLGEPVAGQVRVRVRGREKKTA